VERERRPVADPGVAGLVRGAGGGRVVEDRSEPTTRGVLELTRLLIQVPDLSTTIIPIRDGVSVTLKLS
jgi:predicted O-methyltransferase YrrM